MSKFIVPSSSEAGSPRKQFAPEDEGTITFEASGTTHPVT
jgi:hypothetical protein